jgi:hypothetical protein
LTKTVPPCSKPRGFLAKTGEERSLLNGYRSHDGTRIGKDGIGKLDTPNDPIIPFIEDVSISAY